MKSITSSEKDDTEGLLTERYVSSCRNANALACSFPSINHSPWSIRLRACTLSCMETKPSQKAASYHTLLLLIDLTAPRYNPFSQNTLEHFWTLTKRFSKLSSRVEPCAKASFGDNCLSDSLQSYNVVLKYSMVFFKPSSSFTFGSQSSFSLAKEMSGLRIFGSS